MRVLIDATYTRRGRSGTAVYVERLVAAARELGVEVIEAVNERRRPPGGGGMKSFRNAMDDVRWTQVELPRRARDERADVLHHPLPALARRCPCPQAITVHDLAFEVAPELFDPRFARYASRTHRRAAEGADAVVCVSHATAAEVERFWGITDVVVAPHGPGQELPRVPPRAAPGWVLYVGDDEPRKDVALLREGIARWGEKLPLVIAGAAGSAVTPERLATLFAGALALVHPARLEGFGLTPLEAMTAGVPVVARRSAAVEEVCGDAAGWFSDAEGLASALDRLLDEPSWHDELVARGRARAREFTWERSARAHVEAWERAVGR